MTLNTQTKTLTKRDQEFIWHPYSQHGLHQEILPVVSARGAYLELENGKKIIDAISSWWVNIHGHSHPEISEAVAKQAASLDHVIFSGCTHEPATQLAEKLLSYTSQKGAEFSKIFYSDNGSTAVEVALKMAFQYHRNLGRSKRDRFLALRGSYHGDTLGAMAASEPGGFHEIFQPLLPKVDFIEPEDLDGLETRIKENGEAYAAIIYEPMIQGAGGMRLISKEFNLILIRECKKSGIITIGDEVFTGFFRTGRCFAHEYLGEFPDVLCLSKGITGGVMPLAATLVSDPLFSAFFDTEMKKAFLHGHSFTANPIACAAALASWSLLFKDDCQMRIKEISRQSEEYVNALRKFSAVSSARSIGTIGAITLRGVGNYFDSTHRERILKLAIDRGVLLRPLGNVLYAVPPYCVTNGQLEKIYGTMQEVIETLELQ